MKKTGLEVTTVAFAVILTAFRIPLKLFFIDPFTGFYLRENILGVVFNLLFFLCIGLCLFNTIRNKEDYRGKMRVGTTRCVLFSLSAVGILISSLMEIKKLSKMEFGYANEVPKMLIYPAHIMGIMAGLLLLFFSVSLFSGAEIKKGRLLSLILPVWCSLISLSEFLTYRYTVYASDQLMGTIFMMSSILFFLYTSKNLILPNEEKKYLVFASVTFMTGIPLAVPRLTAILLLKREMTGPDILQCFVTLFISLIAFCFLFPPSKKLEEKQL